MRSFSLLCSLASRVALCAVLFTAVGCDNKTGSNGNTDGGSTNGDMMIPGEDSTLCKGAGCVGAPCTDAAACTEGSTGAAVCWKSTLLDNPKLVATPSGYCSRECTSDNDCGTAKCVSVPGATKQYCMARCSSSLTCRKPGYSCAYDGDKGGICFPNANFDCDPTKSDGKCSFGTDQAAGGCIRAAYENDKGGVCHQECLIGKGTCPPDARFGSSGTAPPQVCIYLDTTADSKGNPAPTGDKWKGNVCFQQSQSPQSAGGSCTYWTDCIDGYQCDRYATSEAASVCRQQCILGNGVQKDPLTNGILVPSTGVTLANGTCANAAEGCANSLRAGVRDGNTGLCQTRQ